ASAMGERALARCRRRRVAAPCRRALGRDDALDREIDGREIGRQDADADRGIAVLAGAIGLERLVERRLDRALRSLAHGRKAPDFGAGYAPPPSSSVRKAKYFLARATTLSASGAGPTPAPTPSASCARSSAFWRASRSASV